MDNPALLFAIAAISMSFAGFASLFLALRPREAGWQSESVAQVNVIVLYALLTLFSALLVVPLASLVGETVVLRAVSAVLFVLVFKDLYELALIAMLGTPALVFVVVVTGLETAPRD